MAITVGTAAGTGTGHFVDTVTISHNPAGTNLLMVVAVAWQTGSGVTISSVVFKGSETLTLHITKQNSLSGAGHVSIYRLKAPSTGAGNVVVTFSGADVDSVVGVITYAGVDQTTPVDAGVSNDGEGTNDATITVTSEAGDLAFAALHSENSATSGAGQTEEWHVTNTVLGAAADKTGGAPNVTLSWTNTQLFYPWTVVGMNINADAAAGPGPLMGAFMMS